MMESNFFHNVGSVKIGGGNFQITNGPDNRRITHHHTQNINDHSRHTTNYERYTNYGQHADGKGRINNYGPQTTNNGPVHGYRQHFQNNRPNFYDNEMNDWTPHSSDDDDGYPEPPPFLDSNQNKYRDRHSSRWQPDSFGAGDQDYYPAPAPPAPAAPRSEPRVGKKRAKETGIPSAKPKQSNLSFDPKSPQFQREYAKMTPDMKDYLRNLGYQPSPRDSLNADTAGDPGRLGSRSPANYARYTPDAARKGKNVAPPSFYDSDEAAEEEQSDESDSDFAPGNSQQHSYVHNDNRVITKNINSNNVNTENVVDSYNDNSTRTQIEKKSAR